MAMKFIDGFDYLTTGNMNLKWDNNGPSSLATGIYGKGKAVNLSFTGAVVKSLGANYTTGMVGLHWFFGVTSNLILLRFQNSGTIQVDLRTNGSGQFFFTQNGTTIGSTSSFTLVPNTWYWLEVQVTISTSGAGVANLYVGSTSVLSQTGLTTGTSVNSFNQIAWVASSSTSNQLDSFHFWDTTAGDVSSYPYGEHVIDTKLANAVGSNTNWSKGGTTINTNNYQQVNEANEDGDTTYVFPTAANTDSYAFANLDETSGTVATVAVNTIARVDDAPATHQFEHYYQNGASNGVSSALTPSATYLNYQTFFATAPGGGGWTISNRNATEFGYTDVS